MILLLDFTIPFTNPIIIFTLVLLIILFAPVIFRKIKIPGIIGLILAGVAVGPYGFNLLAENSSMNLLGPIGLLYLMFLAGLEIDIREFKLNKNTSLFFGSLTFIIPLFFGFLVSYFFLHLEFIGALLLASIFSTQTLISYPIADRLGILKSRAVQITIGGTIITDSAVLLLLAVIMALHNGELSVYFWTKLIFSLCAFVVSVMWILPRISRWFLKYLEGESSSQYIYILLVVFVSALFSQIANVEPIIGAFLAGLALNRLIPHSSALMNRIVFIGNTLFIPFFLLSVGMLVNLKVLFNGSGALIVAFILILTALITKYLAAYITQKIFNYSNIERNVIYGLSSSHAAATIAIILVGYKAGMLSDTILNGTILVILVSCLVSSFFTEISGRKLAIAETNKNITQNTLPERILIPFSNPNNGDKLIEFSAYIKDPNSNETLYPVIVLHDETTAKNKIQEYSSYLEKVLKNTSCADDRIKLHTQIDINIANGISQAVKDHACTTIVMGWASKASTTNYLFGSNIDNILRKTNQMAIIYNPIEPLFLLKKIIVAVPPNAELEIGFISWIKVLINLSRQTNSKIFFFAQSASIEKIKNVVYKTRNIKAHFTNYNSWKNISPILGMLDQSDLFIIVTARIRTISYNKHIAMIPSYLSHNHPAISFAIIYPEQKAMFENASVKIDEISADPIQRNIERIDNIGQIVKTVITKRKRKEK